LTLLCILEWSDEFFYFPDTSVQSRCRAESCLLVSARRTLMFSGLHCKTHLVTSPSFTFWPLVWGAALQGPNMNVDFYNSKTTFNTHQNCQGRKWSHSVHRLNALNCQKCQKVS
jgi:hypothetical protein